MKLLIEDFLPIGVVGIESSREKSLWRAHPFTAHLWWARRPLVACRAAVYATLVPVSRFRPTNGPEKKLESLSRANAAKFVERLCKFPGDPGVIQEAQVHIWKAHAEVLSHETRKTVTANDIAERRASRPKVLDMFAGAGTIPLEALRLGCEAYALDLNPVAHIIQLCTLVYPQIYGGPDPNVRGMTGPENATGETTWGGLAEEVRYWGNWVFKEAKAELGILYPPIPDPDSKTHTPDSQETLWQSANKKDLRPGDLWPVAYLWTRTVRCKNVSCDASVPLVKQTWLCKKPGHYVALKPSAPSNEKTTRFQVVEATTERDLGFDPTIGSKAGNAICSFCGTVADVEYIKDEGWCGRIGAQLLGIVAVSPAKKGKYYLDINDLHECFPSDDEIVTRIETLCARTGLRVPDEPIANLPADSKDNSLGITVRPYGLTVFGSLFTHRQMLTLLTLVDKVRQVKQEAKVAGCDDERIKSVLTFLGLAVDREAENLSSLCRWNANAEKMQGTFGRQVITMVWDFCEVSPFGGSVGDWQSIIDLEVNAIEGASAFGASPAQVIRGSATQVPWPTASFDAVITDPPYYDNVPYADISDFFYVWLRRSIGDLYPEHFASPNTPKRAEAIADPLRHGGDKQKAKVAYEQMILQSFVEANRVLKPGGPLVVVYAHKTTLGWATLIDALRGAGFTVTEAWPLDTEMKSRLRGMESSALATSIFIVARKRDKEEVGSYEDQVRPELEKIVRERVDTLWDMGISGADLVISCVGAGLRAFTRFAHVEYANGEEVPAERFLGEVETVVLENILARLSKEVGANGGPTNLAGVDAATRFYILWRFTYRLADLDAGEAIIFANGTHVELDGPHGLSAGARPLVEKKKGKYRLSDFSDRGNHKELGMPSDDGQAAPLIDALHRALWLMENRPVELPNFLRDAQPNRDQMRLVAQALAGPALKGGELADISPMGELAALAKLTANWRSVIEDVTPSERGARRAGQGALFGKGDNR